MDSQASNHAVTDIGFMQQLFSGKLPTQEQFVNSLSCTDVVQAILLMGVGVVYLIYGWKAFKALVVLNCAVLGTILGNNFGRMLGGNMPWFGAFAGAVLLGVLAWPLMKYAVTLMGCLAGALLGYTVWDYAAVASGQEALTSYAWAGVIIGVLVLGLLAFTVLRSTIIIFTSLQGGAMLTAGVLAVLMKHESLQADLTDALTGNPHLVPLLIAVPAVIGLGFQYTAVAKKAKKKKKAAEGGE